MILSFFHFYSLVILLVSLCFSCFRYFYVFINFIGDIFKLIVKRYWIALEIALYKFSIIIVIIDIYTRLKKIKKGGGINNYKEPNVFDMCVIIRVKRPFVICMVFILRLFPKGTTAQHSN